MPRVVHFEIPSDDPERAGRFYSDVFGWQINKWSEGDYWLVNTGPNSATGINGGILKRRHPQQPVVNTIEVESLDSTLATIQQHGGVVVVPKMPIQGVGWLAYFKDLDGNIFGVMQPDTAAA